MIFVVICADFLYNKQRQYDFEQKVTPDMSPDAYKYIARFLAIFLIIPMHECAHAFVSWKLGDPTAKAMGRLTLNPLKHLDPIGCASMLLWGIGWAKPVPVDPRYYKNPKKGMALSALAGPLSNFLMAFLCMIPFKITYYAFYASGGAQALYFITLILQTLVLINISLAIFNMIPVPPFDGSRILGFFLPDRLYFGVMKYERYVFLGIFALLMLGVFDRPLAYLNSAVWNGMDLATGLLDVVLLKLFGLG